MTVETRVNVTVSADGKAASAELQKLNRDLSDTKVKQFEASQAAAKLRTEFKTLDQSAAGAAAKVVELRNALSTAVAEEQEAARASAAASRAYDEYARSLGKVANSARQMRAASANLGQQIGDIAQGISAGISPATIFAQQSGQVASALGGMGGALGKVGALLSGPWGAALTGALVITAPFVAKLFEGERAAKTKKVADTDLAKAIGELDRATGLANKSAAESIRLSELSTAAEIELTKKKRETAKAELDKARASLAAAEGIQAGGTGIGGLGAGAAAEVARRKAEFDKLDAEIKAGEAASARSARFGRADLASRAAVDPAEKIRQEAEARITAIKALNLSEEEYGRRLTAVRADERAALAKITDARKADTAAAREATREAKAYADQIERLSAIPGKNVALIAGMNRSTPPIGNLAAAAEAESTRGREESGLARIVGNIDAGRSIGAEVAKGFRDGSIADAAAIGNAIGGGLGRAISGISALGLGTRDAKGNLGDFTGVGKKLTSVLEGLGGIFNSDGGRRFAGFVGKAAGGAATGSVISGIGDALGIKNSKAGAQIGGALGGIAAGFGLPGGEIIGSILGGLVGNLFAKSGSTTVSSSGGNISQSGSGNAGVQKATSTLGNTISDTLQAIATQLDGEIGDFSVSIGKFGDKFRVDSRGAGRIRGQGVKNYDEDEGAALAAAIADAIKDGGIVTRSPRVQAVLKQYADNVNKAVAEALKVKGLEDLISDRQNPFAAAFRQLESQLKQRVDVARQYGFDLVEIERINGEDRATALKDSLASATGSIKALLNDLQFGSRATGSATQRLAGLTAERDRLGVLAKGGDQSAIDGFASIIQQIDDLQKETFGKTQGFATGRADSVSLLNDLVKTTEDRIKAAADQARGATDTTNAKLTEANATLDDIARNGFQMVQGIGALNNVMLAISQGQKIVAGNTGFVREK